MKRLLFILMAVMTATSVRAQLFSPESLGGAALGALAGGIIGHNNGRHAAEGAGIGAGAGLVLGALAHNSRQDRVYYSAPPAPVVVAPSYAPSYYAPGPVYYAPAPVYYRPARPNYAVTGTLLGGLAGGIIGHNQGRQTMEGIGIGAGAGLLLGGLAEHQARRQARVVYAQPTVVYSTPAPAVNAPSAPPAETQAPAATAPPAPVINSYPGSTSPMSGANSLFGR